MIASPLATTSRMTGREEGRTRTRTRQLLFHLPTLSFSLPQPNPFLLQFLPFVIIIYIPKRACGRTMGDDGSKWRHAEVGAEEGQKNRVEEEFLFDFKERAEGEWRHG